MEEYKYEILNHNKSKKYKFASRRWKFKSVHCIILMIVLLLSLYFAVHSIFSNQIIHRFKRQKVLLISVDGFRYDLRQKASTPNLDWIVNNGISSDYVMNVFPTITIPNHQSIVTGLYPENHGLLSNKMYDKKTKEKFYMNSNESKFWNDAVPIWIENENQGHKSGNCFWPGYNVLFDGKQANYLPDNNYTSLLDNSNGNMPWNMRIDLAIDWLKNDDVNFVALYIDQPDTIEHKIGPDPQDKFKRLQLKSVIEEIDRAIGSVIDKIKKESLESEVNIIVIGDHGQTQIDPLNKVIDLTKYVNLTDETEFFGDGFIYAKQAKIQSIYTKLKSAERIEGHFKVYLKQDIPNEFHIRNHKRCGDIMFLADPGWTVWQYGKLNRSIIHLGNHLFDNSFKDMNPAFFAYGPVFRTNYTQNVIYSIDVYSLMCHILNIKPRRNDGQLERIKTILSDEYT